MKKKLLLIVLALAILTSLTAGTLAVYTRQVLDETEDVIAKRFACSASGALASGSESITLAPTESMDYNFVVANVDDAESPAAEVPLEFVMTFDFAGAAKEMAGLTATLKYKGGEEALTTNTTGSFVWRTNSPAGKAWQEDYVLTLTWADDGEHNASHSNAGKEKVLTNDLTVTVVATQIT